MALLGETVVTANRTAQPLSDLVADVSVLDREDIERSGAGTLPDILARVPGIEMARNGGPGTTTSLFIRGGETRYTAVFVDGVRVDTQSGSGGAPWENIPLALIDRIEVLRGPAGAVYGADAMSGVIQIFTRKGEGGFSPFVSTGVGTYSTRKTEAGFSGSHEGFDYALGVGDESSKGFNARPVAAQNGDDDGYNRQSANARLGWQITPTQRVEATGLSSNMNSSYDTSAKDDKSLYQLQTMGLNWLAQWTGAYSTRLSATDARNRYETEPSVSKSITQQRGYLFQNEYRVGPQLFTAALERREDRLDNSTTTPATTARALNGLALGYGFSGKQHTLQLQARQDQ
ncbi:MAG: TonB-dependent receptor plug domain-containing protein, partial [Hylemonella sp.]